MKRLQTKLLITLLLAYMPGVFLSSAWAGEEFKQGVKLVNERRFAEATKVLKKAVVSEPSNPNALYYLALSWHYQGRTSDAMVNYQAILKKFPGTDAANRAYQAISLMSLPPGTTDAQWYPKPATSSAGGSVRTYSGGSSSASVQTYGSSNLPEQSTIFFEKGDSGLKVDCFINNRPIKMVFDTGATGIVVGKNQLEEMGIKPPEGAASGQSGGSSNTNLQSFWIMNADVKVGTIVRQNFPIKVLSYNAAAPLLGQSFIQDFDYSIDRNGGVIRLKRKGAGGGGGGGSSARGGYSVPFTWEGPKMLVHVEVNGRPYPMYFDTGNSASAVSFGMDDLKALNINPDDGEMTSTSGVSGSGNGLRFRVKRLKLGPIEKYDIPVIASYESKGRPLVGQDLYEGYEYTVDNDARLIRFIRR